MCCVYPMNFSLSTGQVRKPGRDEALKTLARKNGNEFFARGYICGVDFFFTINSLAWTDLWEELASCLTRPWGKEIQTKQVYTAEVKESQVRRPMGGLKGRTKEKVMAGRGSKPEFKGTDQKKKMVSTRGMEDSETNFPHILCFSGAPRPHHQEWKYKPLIKA